jgi:hypothetical protein
MISEVVIKRPYFSLLLNNRVLLPVTLPLEVLFHLTHDFGLFQVPFLLSVELSAELHDLILLDDRLIVEDLSQLLFILFQLLRVCKHLGGLSTQLLHGFGQLVVLGLEQGDLFLQVLELTLESEHGFTIAGGEELRGAEG